MPTSHSVKTSSKVHQESTQYTDTQITSVMHNLFQSAPRNVRSCVCFKAATVSKQANKIAANFDPQKQDC